ncbi:hypothetical protein Y717_33660 [Streptomyces scopuliridis RB72]|uniref:Uncharacterized protein n=1 Tax=Streptomyces scopuliridis RB72 TaxID=1440053 RepID=A0A2T7T5L2_9ACTN|nr:hypothetical protein Y717_33660 [Streptomyces scopuliridis RB72]
MPSRSDGGTGAGAAPADWAVARSTVVMRPPSADSAVLFDSLLCPGLFPGVDRRYMLPPGPFRGLRLSGFMGVYAS